MLATSTRGARGNVVALATYAILSLLFHWPLPAHLLDALTGQVTSDLGVYVWNLWVFRHEIVAHGHLPFFTNEILALTPPIDLSLHNYTLFADVLAYPLIPGLGVVGAFNVVFLSLTTLTAWTMFLLARRLTQRWPEAWLAGAMFGFSPVLVARSTAHFSLATAAALPVFVICLLRAERECSTRNAMAVGATIAWAAVCDAYFGIYCLIIGACYLAGRRWRVVFDPPLLPHRRSFRSVDALIAILALVTLLIVTTGGGILSLGSLRIGLMSMYTPVLGLTMLIVLRWWLRVRPRLEPTAPLATRAGVRAVAVAGATCAVLLSPLLYALVWRLADGGSFHHPFPWRNSPSGVDLLAFVTPNPNHPWFRAAWHPWFAGLPGGFAENVAALTFVGLGVVLAAMLGARYRVPREWMALLLLFGSLALGPFISVGGVNTFIPGPWAFIRYLPLFSATRTPARFAIVAMMAFSIIFALSLAHLAGREPRRRALVLGMVTLLLLIELAPAPRQLFSTTAPAIYATIAKDPREISVLEIPFGFADGERSQGAFSGDAQFFQTVHQKAILSGALSRITDNELARQRAFPVVRALLVLSEGGEPAGGLLEEAAAEASQLVQDARIGYVVINSATTAPALREFAIQAFRLRKVGEDGGRELFVPGDVQVTATGVPMTVQAIR